LHAAGYTFAARYLSYDTTGKNLTASEASALQAAGVDVVANWEYGASDALNGSARGASDAQEALRQANAAGMPAGRPIYFSVDFDATEAQQAAINDYFDGVASVLGLARTGAYGGFYPIQRLFNAGKITWGWQTYAWSGGQWDSRAQVRQTLNGVTIAGGECDIDEAQTNDFGQWRSASAPPTTKYWVDTFANATGYSSPGGAATGTLNAGTNYVFCKKWGPEVRVGTQYNHYWMLTDLDSGNPWQNQYVSAYYLSRWGNDEAMDNNGTVLPDCP
jgi:hypothetical protein